MSAVLDLCDRWDALSKGETETTRAIREAYAQDLRSIVSEPCGRRSVIAYGVIDADRSAIYTQPCVLPIHHSGAHQDAEGMGWEATR